MFHPDANAAVMADAERGMSRSSPTVAYQLLLSLAGLDPNPSVRRLSVPLRAINGDRYSTDVQAIQTVKADFDAIVMKHVGHYPMLERPEEFNQHVAEVVDALSKQGVKPSEAAGCL